MKIMDFLSDKAVSVDLRSKTKKDVINELVDLLGQAVEIKNKGELVNILLAREALGSTGIGQGIGIPHGKSPNVKKLTAAFALSKEGVNFESLDGEPTHIFFLLVAPEESAGPHLKALARISRLLKDKYFRDTLIKANDPKEVLKIIKTEDSKRS
jgi:PTS system nitrogen regulatory IIA component